MSSKNDYQSPALLEIGSLHELTLQHVGLDKIGTNADALSSTLNIQGDISNVSIT